MINFGKSDDRDNLQAKGGGCIMVSCSTTLGLELDTKSAETLKEIATEVGAFLPGEYVLSSGKSSDRGYFDGKMVTLSPKGAYYVGKAIFDEISTLGVDAVGGLVIGAALMVSAVAVISYIEGKPIPTFIVREQPKGHGTYKKIEGHLQPGSRVVIVDDVITTGTSVFEAIRAVEAEHCQVVKVIALVDRHEGGSEKLINEHYDFTAFLRFLNAGGVVVGQPAL